MSSKVLNHTTLANTAIYARLNLAPVKAALGKYADTFLGMCSASVAEPTASVLPVMSRAPTTPPSHQTAGWSPARGEEREKWPG